MADAGKIVITPKGAYSSTKTYEWLDEVTYDGKAYIALKTVTGVTPSDDGVNWRLFLEPNDIVAGNLVPTFTEASTRSNIISEENLSTILGKVKKYFTDLKGHAFNDTVKNLTTEETGSALDASQGKVLKDEVDEINSNLDGLEYSEIAGGKNLAKVDTLEIKKADTFITDYDLPIGTYTISFDANTSGAVDFYSKESSTAISSVSCDFNSTSRAKKTFTVNAPTKLSSYSTTTAIISNIQIEEGSVATDYEPYIPSVKMLAEENVQQNIEAMDLKMLGWTVPKECPIQNEVSGNNFIKKVGRVDLGTFNFNLQNNLFHVITNLPMKTYSVLDNQNVYCNKYTSYSWNDFQDATKGIAFQNGSTVLRIKDTSYTDATTFKNAMQGVYLYYELATPITHTIDGNEVTERINESLADYGLNNVIGNITQGSIYADNGAINAADTSRVVTSELHPCKNGDVITIKRNSNVKFYMYLYNSDETVKSGTSWDSTSDTYKITHNGYYRVIFAFTDDSTISPISCGNIRLYQNSTIDRLKNDLDKLNSLPKGSIIQIEADKDDIETTTQKYGWQYLGTSNIQYENGSTNLLVTNVYRKNN